MKVKEAIEVIQDAGLKVYCPKIKDSGFLKLYLKPLNKIMPKLSGNCIKVLLALSSGLDWNNPEVFFPIEAIVKQTGLNKETVRICLDELEKNLVVRRVGPNIRRSYIVSDHYVRLGKNK